MSIIGCIPSRFDSTRFPGKPLALIRGRPMILWVCEGASKSKLIDQVLVATDDQRIFDVVVGAGYKAQMTSRDCPSGTDRIQEAISKAGLPADIIVNIQGDEPLVSAEVLDSLIQPLLTDPKLEMSTVAHQTSWAEADSPNVVKVISDELGNAIYFSRFLIPHSRGKGNAPEPLALRHIGLYAYRADFLKKFCSKVPCAIEVHEGLEQLRALHLGAQIRVVKVTHRSWGVDTPEDLEKIDDLLNQTGGAL